MLRNPDGTGYMWNRHGLHSHLNEQIRQQVNHAGVGGSSPPVATIHIQRLMKPSLCRLFVVSAG